MSWLFSRALVEEFLAENCLDGELYALSKSTPMPLGYLQPDRMTAFSRLSRFGMTFGPLMDDLGEDVLTWFLAAFYVNHIAQRLPEKTLQMISGRKCNGSWQMSLPGTYLPRTSNDARLMQRPTTLSRWVTKPSALPLERKTWVRTTFGNDIGFLHTPTVTANYAAPSMQKWPSARAFVRVFGKPTPTNHEWLMGWPPGWTDSRPLETDKYLSWQQLHGESL
nr:hypothetical protein [Ralstonia mannitolilytica]